MPRFIQVLLLSILNCFSAFYFLHYMLDPIDEEVFNVHYPKYNYISSVYYYYVLKKLAFLLTLLIFLLDPMEKVSFDVVLCKKV